jgi:hypothetical protein
MSRSKRSAPIIGITTAESEKDDKRAANRALRRVTRQVIRAEGAEHDVTPVLREVSDPWRMDKDGKRWWGHGPGAERAKLMRK